MCVELKSEEGRREGERLEGRLEAVGFGGRGEGGAVL